MKKSDTVLRVALVGVVFCAIVAFFGFGLNHYLSRDALRANEAFLRTSVSDHPVLAPVAFVALYVAIVTLSLPGAAIMTLAGGFIFGLWLGAVLNITGATIGAVLLFVLARFVAGDALRARAGPFMARMADGFERNAFSYLLFLRLVPLFPFWAVNLAAALLGVPLATFAVTTLIGIIPGSLAYTAIGDGLRLATSQEQTGVSSTTIALRVGLALLAVIPIAVQWLRRRYAR